MYSPYNLEDVHDASAQEKFKVISTFAGGGGSSTGYRLAGGEVLCMNEFVEEAQKSFEENYPVTIILPGVIPRNSCFHCHDRLVIPKVPNISAAAESHRMTYKQIIINYLFDEKNIVNN